LNPRDYSAHNNLGIVYSKLGSHSLALKAFEAAIQLNPQNASIYFNIGLLNHSTGNKEKAYDAFKHAITLNPKYKLKVNLD
jgi:Flp pilus assembly protein TadD